MTMLGNIMCGLIAWVAIGLIFVIPSAVVWCVAELPRKVREHREMSVFKKEHKFFCSKVYKY